MNELLCVQNLTVTTGEKKLVNDVSFEVPKGKIVAIAGGSGSGKTTIALSILRLLSPALSLRHGRIVFEGKNLLELSSEDMREQRGGRIGMIFQEPLSAFDPLFTIGKQLDEVLAAHTSLGSNQRTQKILDEFSQVGLDPVKAHRSYPHQLSGGMRQRAMVAQAMIAGPALIIADEPTSNLDVTLQVKIIELFLHLKARGIAVLLIAHDLGMISRLADEVIILHQGQIVESGDCRQVIHGPKHEYTRLLIEAFQ